MCWFLWLMTLQQQQQQLVDEIFSLMLTPDHVEEEAILANFRIVIIKHFSPTNLRQILNPTTTMK